ncbi:LppU/SCO3897 family protein [Williamsia sp.]|uniref:LppU/SCO3897 family protein n=1 Tax=Williamsia sp. TaxID=1872085 RepID=UPI002F930365
MSDHGPYPGAPGPGGPGGDNPYGQQNPGPMYPQQPGQAYPQQPGPVYPQQPGQPYPQQPGQPYPQQPGPVYPQPGAQPYGAVPQYGASPYGNYQQPPNRNKRTLWVVLGVVAAVLVAGVIAVVALAVVLAEDIDDVEAGDCVRVTGANTDVDFEIVDCDTTSPLNFIVAEKLGSASDSCGGEQYSELTEQGEDATKLCLVPNFQEGSCYEVPLLSLTGMKEVPCGDVGSSQINTVVKVITRVESTTVPGCPDAITFDRPEPIGFCLASPTE